MQCRIVDINVTKPVGSFGVQKCQKSRRHPRHHLPATTTQKIVDSTPSRT